MHIILFVLFLCLYCCCIWHTCADCDDNAIDINNATTTNANVNILSPSNVFHYMQARNLARSNGLVNRTTPSLT